MPRERPLINKIGSGILDGMIRSATYGALSTDRINRMRDSWHNMMERHRAGGGGQILRAQPVNAPQPANTQWYDAPVNTQWWDAPAAPATPDDPRGGRAPGMSMARATGIARYGSYGSGGLGDASLSSAGFGGGGSFDYAPGGGGRISQLMLAKLLLH